MAISYPRLFYVTSLPIYLIQTEAQLALAVEWLLRQLQCHHALEWQWSEIYCYTRVQLLCSSCVQLRFRSGFSVNCMCPNEPIFMTYDDVDER